MHYHASCHCGAVQLDFEGPEIHKGIRCNCSICVRKGASMTPFLLTSEELKISAPDDALSYYEFGSGVAKHYFCNYCGIYTHNETRRKPGYYRVNLGCIEGLDSMALPYDVFDGASL